MVDCGLLMLMLIEVFVRFEEGNFMLFMKYNFEANLLFAENISVLL